MKNTEKNETKSRLAKGIDYFSVRVAIFILATITLNQFGLHFYASVILAIFITAIINRQVNFCKQKRLTKMARKKSQQDLSSETNVQKVNQEDKTKALKPFNFLMSAMFLYGLGFFFSGWFKYYFYIFSFINVLAAVISLVKLKKSSIIIKEEGK